MIRRKNETEEYFLLSITKKCETLIKQTHRKVKETLEFKLNKTRKTCPFNPKLSLEVSWMIGLTNLKK